MVQVRTRLKVADNSGAKEVMVIGVLGGTRRRFASVGDIIVCSAKLVTPNTAIKKGDKVKAVVVRTKKKIKRSDGTTVRFDENAAILIKEDKTPRATRVFGTIAREVKDAGFNKIASLASEIV